MVKSKKSFLFTKDIRRGKLQAKIKLPDSVNPDGFMKLVDLIKPEYTNAAIDKKMIRRSKIATNIYPGPVTTDNGDEFYLDAVVRKIEFSKAFLKQSKNKPEELFVVVWTGWPDEYATIEPLRNIEETAAYEEWLTLSNGILIGTGARKCSLARRSSFPGSSEACVPMRSKHQEPADEIEKLFHRQQQQGHYSPLVGFTGYVHQKLILRRYNIET